MTEPQQQKPPPQPKAQLVPVHDSSEFANLMDSSRFDHLWRVASCFARSTLVPKHFQQSPENCFLGIQMAIRLGVDPFMFLQKCYIVHGRLGLESQLAIALVNTAGIFRNALDYEVFGDEPRKYAASNDKDNPALINGQQKNDYRVRAFAVRNSNSLAVYGPWVDWSLVESERWHAKEYSKWLTMPGLMFRYRAAMFFARMHCPERLLGMETVEEVQDVGPKIAEASPAPYTNGSGEGPLTNRPVFEPKARPSPRPQEGISAAEAAERFRPKPADNQHNPATNHEAAADAKEAAAESQRRIYEMLLARCRAIKRNDEVSLLRSNIAERLTSRAITDEQACDLNSVIEEETLSHDW